MPDIPLTVFSLAGLEASGPVPPLNAAERQQLVENLRRKAAEVAALSKFDLGQRLLSVLEDSMKKPLADLLQEFWKQRAEMRNVTARKGNERDVVGDVELVDHSLTWKLQPSIKVEVKGVPVHTLHLTVATKLTLQGIKLVMKNSCITSVEAGTLKAVTTLTYDDAAGPGGSGQHFQLLPAISRSVKLPGTLKLPGGGLCLT
jgi:hypothetical protein